MQRPGGEPAGKEIDMTKPKKQKSKKPVEAKKSEPSKMHAAAPTERDPRLPAPGTTIDRVYKKKTYAVEVLDRGFKFDGREWRSLTAIAKAITKAPAISGPRFFGIVQPASTTGKAK
jgi:hypothetical protein